jgi:hypothetical protein
MELQQVCMILMISFIEAIREAGEEPAVKLELQDGQLPFAVSDSFHHPNRVPL